MNEIESLSIHICDLSFMQYFTSKAKTTMIKGILESPRIDSQRKTD
jgi:hypothetical protein